MFTVVLFAIGKNWKQPKMPNNIIHHYVTFLAEPLHGMEYDKCYAAKKNANGMGFLGQPQEVSTNYVA